MPSPQMSALVAFNSVAQPDKVVSIREVKKNYLDIVSKELTFWEKIRRHLMKPKSVINAVKLGMKLAINDDVKDMFAAANSDGTQGMYKNNISGEKFISTGYCASVIKYIEMTDTRDANSPLSVKLADIFARAINASADRATEVRSSRAFKPI